MAHVTGVGTAGLDRESVRETLAHFQAMNERHEREEHAHQNEIECASACGAAADEENQCGLDCPQRQDKKCLNEIEKTDSRIGRFQHR